MNNETDKEHDTIEMIGIGVSVFIFVGILGSLLIIYRIFSYTLGPTYVSRNKYYRSHPRTMKYKKKLSPIIQQQE